MANSFTYPELCSIRFIWRSLELVDRKLKTESELAASLIEELVDKETFRVAAHCASLLPLGSRGPLAKFLRELEDNDYFGRVEYVGPGLSEDQQRALQPRFRHAAECLREILVNPETPPDMPSFPSPDDIIPLLSNYKDRRCLYINNRVVCLADIESAPTAPDLFHATLVAASDVPLVARFDNGLQYDADPSQPFGDRWEISQKWNIYTLFFAQDDWDCLRTRGWRILFATDVIQRFVNHDDSWMEDYF